MNDLNWGLIIGSLITISGALISSYASKHDDDKEKKIKFAWLSGVVVVLGVIVTFISTTVKDRQDLQSKIEDRDSAIVLKNYVIALKDSLHNSNDSIHAYQLLLAKSNSDIKHVVDSSQIVLLQSFIAQNKLQNTVDSIRSAHAYNVPLLGFLLPRVTNPKIVVGKDTTFIELVVTNYTQYVAEDIKGVIGAFGIHNDTTYFLTQPQPYDFPRLVGSGLGAKLEVALPKVKISDLKCDDIILFVGMSYRNSNGAEMKPVHTFYKIDHCRDKIESNEIYDAKTVTKYYTLLKDFDVF